MGDKTTVKMDKKLVKRAHELGLSVSKVCENALTVAVGALEGTIERPSSGKKKENHNPLKMPLLKPICRRVSGQPSGESLRKLCPSIRLVGPEGPGREARQWHRNGTYRLAL